MSACVVEEGREEGGGACALEAGPSMDRDELPERPRREVLLSARGRRACSEQGPHPSLNLRKLFICTYSCVIYLMSYFNGFSTLSFCDKYHNLLKVHILVLVDV